MTNDNDRIAARNRLLLLRSRDFDDWKVDTLIDWSRDADSSVRDWATCALALRDDDSDAIRAALLERVSDIDFDTKSEAMLGLARRGDVRVLPYLIEALTCGHVGTLFVEAASHLALEQLIEPLQNLTTWWDVDEALLAEAIENCRANGSAGGNLPSRS